MQARNLLKRAVPNFLAKRYNRSEPWQVENFLEIGNRGIFSEEHDMFRESVRKFFADHVTMKDMDRWEANGMVEREIWLKVRL